MIISIEDLLNSIPEDIRTPEIVERVKQAYENEIESIKYYQSKAAIPEAELTSFQKNGTQYVSEFYVNDLAKSKEDKINWHFQNISQWLYAGCILIDNNQVSTHH